MTHVEAVSPPKCSAIPSLAWTFYSRGLRELEQVTPAPRRNADSTFRGFQGPLRFPVGFACLDCGALIVLSFPLGQRDLQFGMTPFPVKCQRHERVTATLGCPDELSNLRTMQQELATATRIGVHVCRGGRERREVGTDKIYLPILQDHVTFFELRAPGSQALYFPTLESQPGFESILQEIVVPRLFIERDGVAVRRSFLCAHHECICCGEAYLNCHAHSNEHGCSRAAKAKDGRERPMDTDVQVPRRPGMPECRGD
jgi:hypothetical protein